MILAGTGILELALAAGLAVGSPRVLELTLAVPLAVPARGGLRVQVRVEAADAQGRRAFLLHSQDEASSAGSGGWTRHALGVLAEPEAAGAAAAAVPLLKDWPPAGATPLEMSVFYARLSARGLDYRPAFQRLTGIWRLGQAIYGQVALPAGTSFGAGEYDNHPALFDAALHVLVDAALHVLAAAEGSAADRERGALLPFAWSDVTLHARGASELRVRLDLSTCGEGPEQASGSMVMCDGTGQPVTTVGCLTLRRATAEQVRAAVQSKREELPRVGWQPVPLAQSAVVPEKVVVVGGTGRLAVGLGVGQVADVAALRALLDAGETAPDRVIVDATRWPGCLDGKEPAIELPSSLQDETARVLGDVQALLSDVRLAPAALMWVTSSAISTGADDGVDDLVHAPLWGLLRSTRNEHPDRILRLLDVEGEALTGEQLWPLVVADGEPELAWRNRRELAARLSESEMTVQANALWSARTLMRPALRRAAAGSPAASALRRRLTELPGNERLRTLVTLVQEVVVAVLGLAGTAAIAANQPLKELGLDSLMAVEVSNRLSARAEISLPTTLVFDYPTPVAIAKLLLRQVFAELDATARYGATPRRVSDEPIAILAMSCRTPGAVEDSDGYWALLAEGRDTIGPFPARWDSDALYDSNPKARGKTYVREGGFLRNVDEFDAGFFNIAPREAVSMDPQQRLVLEVAWEALEQAGLMPEALNESSTGVYLGSMGSDYGQHGASLESLDGYVETGQASSVLSGRVSYALGLQGPAMTVDTACSSSLVALHLACAGLRQGECDLALAGGVQVMSTPARFVEFSRLRGLAPDGRCKSFSERADGAGWSEGCGILVLKRLSDAERDGDRVLAVVRGSAVNQDGRSQGLTAPNGLSQQRVIRRALSVSGLEPSDIDAMEAHGTGTTLGDPIEAGALAEVFGPTRREGEPLYLGSSKSNLGHTLAAAGVLGVIKMVLALQHEHLPKTLHAERPSEQIEWAGSGLSLLQEARAWPRDASRVRRAGVSSFGISGTNAHVVLEEAPAREATELNGAAVAEEAASRLSIPLLVSGRDEAALRAQAERYAEWLSTHPDIDWADVPSTAALHRTHFAARASVSARDAAAATAALRALAAGRSHAAVSLGEAKDERGGKLAFLFTGQGAQQLGMGRALFESCPVFREAFEEVCGHFDELLDLPLRVVLFAEAGSEQAAKLNETAYTQPALFAVEVALFRQLESWGVHPEILLGHSIGELAAAHVAGVWSLKDACRVVAARGRLMQALPEGGAMISVEASEAEVLVLLAQYAGVEIAGLNGPRSTVISGDEAAIVAMAEHFRAEGRQAKRLQVSHAFHSKRMDPMLEEFRKDAGVGELWNSAPADREQRDGAAGDNRGALQPGVLGATGP